MKSVQTFQIMLGITNPSFSNKLMKRLTTIQKANERTMKLDIKVCKTLAECQGKLSKKAHLMLLDFVESQQESEAEKQQIQAFCKQHQVINVRSEKELLLAISMMNKGVWNYIGA